MKIHVAGVNVLRQRQDATQFCVSSKFQPRLNANVIFLQVFFWISSHIWPSSGVQVLCFYYFNGTVGKPFMGRCALSLFYNVFTCCGEVLNIESFFAENSIQSKLWDIGEFCAHSWYCSKPPQWLGFHESDLEIFRSKMQEIFNFE